MTTSAHSYKVLITCSGTGSRLKDLTKHSNKALITINEKQVISYIIDSYPENIELIFTIGYLKNQVKQFVKTHYPNRKITFVEIDNFDGPGSSLGYSMLQAEKYLQCPFIFHCNDTIVFEPIPSPLEYNWNGGSRGNNPEIFTTLLYSSLKVVNGNMTQIKQKGEYSYDFFHIGLVGIKDYKQYWLYLNQIYNENPFDQTLNDVLVINRMLQNNITFRAVEFKHWLDTGNPSSLKNANGSPYFYSNNMFINNAS